MLDDVWKEKYRMLDTECQDCMCMLVTMETEE